MKNYIITVARGFGTGGKEIASTLAKKLGIECYENRILTLASQLSGIDKAVFEEVDERIRPELMVGFLKGLPKLKTPRSVDKQFVSDDKLFQYQKEIILDLASKESCVIVGKCADWVLKDFDNVLSVYIEAPRDFCVDRIMKKMNVSKEVANSSIEMTDKYRAEYYQYYSGGNYWTNPVNYDITLNSKKLGIENCVSLIETTLKTKFPDLELE